MSISERYSAPFMPHGSVDSSTSKESCSLSANGHDIPLPLRSTDLLIRELDVHVFLSVGVEEVHARRSTVVRAVAGGNVLSEGHKVSVSGDSACFVVESLDDTVFAARYAVEAQCAGVARRIDSDRA